MSFTTSRTIRVAAGRVKSLMAAPPVSEASRFRSRARSEAPAGRARGRVHGSDELSDSRRARLPSPIALPARRPRRPQEPDAVRDAFHPALGAGVVSGFAHEVSKGGRKRERVDRCGYCRPGDFRPPTSILFHRTPLKQREKYGRPSGVAWRVGSEAPTTERPPSPAQLLRREQLRDERQCRPH